MPERDDYQDSPPGPQASSEVSSNDSKFERELWKEFYYRDGKHESDINHINRQLTVIQTEIFGNRVEITKVKEELKDDIAKTKEELKDDNTKIKEELKVVKLEFKSDMALLTTKVETVMNSSRNLSIGTILALVAILATLWLRQQI
ncbi:MAG: hypothetical protein LBW85_08815 [Deltaproteobacteria bacterium]|jgi:hypothetical protein|nr:hypothetical protein [Deltaproteobacteria bacterium]